jgi:hypothetical protein
MTPDEEVVERQIGRRPRGLLGVESRCAWGYPVAISVAPLVAERRGRGPREPFPTTFWLTCPILVEQASRMESEGLIARLEDEAAADPALAARIAADHARYAAARVALLSPADREEARRRGLLPVLERSGVGGVREPRSVKCLHAHLAHHRARGGNAVAEAMEARGGLRECTEAEIRCRAFGAPPAGEAPRMPPGGTP